MTDSRALRLRGLWLIAGSLLVLVAVGGVMLWAGATAPTRDPATGQQLGRQISNDIVVLVDATDSLSQRQQQALIAWTGQLERSELCTNERVTVWRLGRQPDGDLVRVFSRCYPGRATDEVLNNPTMAASQCDSEFSVPLRRHLLIAAGGRPAGHSRVLEAVQELSEQPELAPRSGMRRLVLVSDLEQHEPGVTFYRVADVDALIHSKRFRELQANLRGVRVDVLYVGRPSDLVVGRSIRDFWRAYFAASGADSIQFERL